MYEMRVKSTKYPAGKILGVDDGNFHLLAGVRCCCTLFSEDRLVLDKRVVVIAGDDFGTMMNKAKGLNFFKQAVLNKMECEEEK